MPRKPLASRRQRGGLIEDAEVVNQEARRVIRGLESVGDMSAITAALERAYPDPAERAQIFRRVMEIGNELHAELAATAAADPVEAAARRVFEAITQDAQIDGRDPLDWVEHKFPRHFDEIVAAATEMAGGADDGQSDFAEAMAADVHLQVLEDAFNDISRRVIDTNPAISEEQAASFNRVQDIIDSADAAINGDARVNWDALNEMITAGLALVDVLEAELWPEPKPAVLSSYAAEAA